MLLLLLLLLLLPLPLQLPPLPLKIIILTATINIGTSTVHELFWMLQCNSTSNDESTFLILKIDWVFAGNWVLRYINKNAKGWVDPHAKYSLSSVFPWYIWWSAININSPNVDKKEKSKVSSKFLKKMWLIEYRIVTTYQDFYYCHIWLYHHNSRGFHVRFYPMKQSFTLTT